MSARTSAWMDRLNAEYESDDALTLRTTWAAENSADDIPAQIASWRAEAAKWFGLVLKEEGKRGTDTAWIRAKGMQAMADQIEYLWNLHQRASG